MAKKFHHPDHGHHPLSHSHHNENVTPTFEDWEGPKGEMPESDLGDTREGIDNQIRGNDIRKSRIKPRGV